MKKFAIFLTAFAFTSFSFTPVSAVDLSLIGPGGRLHGADIGVKEKLVKANAVRKIASFFIVQSLQLQFLGFQRWRSEERGDDEVVLLHSCGPLQVCWHR